MWWHVIAEQLQKGHPRLGRPQGHQPHWQVSPDKTPVGPPGSLVLLPFLSLVQEGSRGVSLQLPGQRAVPWQQGCLRKGSNPACR